MNQSDVIKAILAGEPLDIKHPDAPWHTFNRVETPIETTLDVYINGYQDRYDKAEFRIRPKIKIYQSRAYIVAETNIFHWVSMDKIPQAEALKMYDNQARWIEETQTKEYV
jgi:hypothetical protein